MLGSYQPTFGVVMSLFLGLVHVFYSYLSLILYSQLIIYLLHNFSVIFFFYTRFYTRLDPPASSLMPRPIPDLLRNGDSGMGRSRQDSADLENLDFDPIDYSMKGLSKLQLNEPRARRTHAASPQQPNRLIYFIYFAF